MSQQEPDGNGDDVAALRTEIAELRTQLKQQCVRTEALATSLDLVKTLIAGDPDEFAAWEPAAMTPIVERLDAIEDQLTEHADKFEMFVVEDGSHGTPDQRALHLRQVLYNAAKKNSGKARLDRDGAEASLGGGLHRASVIDAMRRAANGHEAQINGASDLQPVPGVEFRAGQGKDEQSVVEMDLTQIAPADLRKNLTTKDTGTGGQE